MEKKFVQPAIKRLNTKTNHYTKNVTDVEKRLEEQMNICEIEILNRMNKRKYKNEHN